MTHRLGVILVSTVVLFVAARRVEAQSAPAGVTQGTQPTPKQLKEARVHFTAAEAAKARGEYQTAAAEYLAAYQLFQDPEFFFDTAEVYRLAGIEETALTYYEKYLELDPNGRGAQAARVQSDRLRRSIAVKQDAIRRDDDARRKAEDDARRKAEDDARRKADEAARLEAVRADRARTGRHLRLGGIVAGGAGVVALGVGVILGFKARNISNELSNNTDAFDRSRYDEGKAADRNMFIFTGIGGVAVVAGAVLYYVGHRATRTDEIAAGSRVAFAPAVGPSQIAFSAVGHF